MPTVKFQDERVIPESMKLLSRMSVKYRETCDWYQKWVSENPDVVGQVEKTFRVLSYCLSGFAENSQIIGEFVYSLSNLLVFFNDSILRKDRPNLLPKVSLSQQRVMRWLTVLNHTEVFFELASRQVWGETGKWIIIAGIQLLRTILRLVLLRYLKSGIQSSPPIQPLDRQKVTPRSATSTSPSRDHIPTLPSLDHPPHSVHSAAGGSSNSSPHPEGQTVTFKGGRSGRVIRCLHATPDIGIRKWKLPNEQPIREEDLGVTELAGFSLAGETLYISRPLIHLSCLCVWGWASWVPWLVSLSTDVASLELMKKHVKAKFNSREKKELVDRRLMLLFYLLRSPCFNVFTQSRLESLLQSTGESIPGTGVITKPLLDYLPVWQKIYSYNWAH